MNNYLMLGVICCSFFGAGIVDVAYPDVIPMRPYSVFFITGLALRKRHSGHKDYYPNRQYTQIIEQINEDKAQYLQRKKKAFKEKYGK